MELLFFYLLSIIAIISTILIVITNNPIHALLSLISSLITISLIFFLIGTSFIGAMEIIIYTSAIMVLFVFVVMMLNFNNSNKIKLISNWLYLFLILIICALMTILLILSPSFGLENMIINITTNNNITYKTIGLVLFNNYILAVEISSMLLLAGLIVSYHLGKNRKYHDN